MTNTLLILLPICAFLTFGGCYLIKKKCFPNKKESILDFYINNKIKEIELSKNYETKEEI